MRLKGIFRLVNKDKVIKLVNSFGGPMRIRKNLEEGCVKFIIFG